MISEQRNRELCRLNLVFFMIIRIVREFHIPYWEVISGRSLMYSVSFGGALRRKSQKSLEPQIPQISRITFLTEGKEVNVFRISPDRLRSGQAQVATRRDIRVIRVIRLIRGGSYLCFSSQSFWNAGSPRNGSQTGSSLRSAGVTGVSSRIHQPL